MLRVRPDWLARQMKRRGWRYATELAYQTGLSIPTAQDLVNGVWQKRADAKTLQALATTFGVTDPVKLLEWQDS